MGMWRAISDLSSAVRERLGDDIGAFTESELEREIGEMQGLEYIVEEFEGDRMQRIKLREGNSGDGVRREKFRLGWRRKYC
jgi:hypothetical protein